MLGLVACEAALRDRSGWHDELIATLRQHRDRLATVVESIPGMRMSPVEATYLALIDVRPLGLKQPARHFENHGLGLSDGADFGAPGWPFSATKITTFATPGALVFSTANGNAITVADVDGGSLTTTVAVTNGTFTLGSTAGVTVTGNGTGSVTLSGTAAAINAALAGASYTSTPDYNGPAQLTVTTSDLGNTGSGGTLTDVDTVTLAITAVNINAAAGQLVTVTFTLKDAAGAPVAGAEEKNFDFYLAKRVAGNNSNVRVDVTVGDGKYVRATGDFNRLMADLRGRGKPGVPAVRALLRPGIEQVARDRKSVV